MTADRRSDPRCEPATKNRFRKEKQAWHLPEKQRTPPERLCRKWRRTCRIWSGSSRPHETPLLDALGDPLREATSTHHEWLEDELLPNKDAINDAAWTNPAADTTFDVDNGSRFRVGDQIQVEGSEELMLVTAVAGNTLTVVRGYAGTTPENLANDKMLNILGNAALEGDDKPNARFTNRVRSGNYTQIFTAAVEVSGSDMAASQLGLADEMDYQKQGRLRELLRDLENTVDQRRPARRPIRRAAAPSAGR